jgi:hypothetical protein
MDYSVVITHNGEKARLSVSSVMVSLLNKRNGQTLIPIVNLRCRTPIKPKQAHKIATRYQRQPKHKGKQND